MTPSEYLEMLAAKKRAWVKASIVPNPEYVIAEARALEAAAADLRAGLHEVGEAA